MYQVHAYVNVYVYAYVYGLRECKCVSKGLLFEACLINIRVYECICLYDMSMTLSVLGYVFVYMCKVNSEVGNDFCGVYVVSDDVVYVVETPYGRVVVVNVVVVC